MSRFVLDSQLRSRLNGLNEQMEVVDEQGRPLGQFLPQHVYLELMYAWAGKQLTDDAEKQQARAEVRHSGGLTTQEAIAHIEQLAGQARDPS
jgi:hypothetical protein